MLDRRSGGILLHPSSLPSHYGIGDLGSAAFEFVSFLARARQSLWQVLPLGPTGFGDSPYASPSAFAGNPLLISPEPLLADGLLSQDDVADLERLPTGHVDFASLPALKLRALHTAFDRARERQELRQRIEAFRQAHAAWLDDFALFAALNERMQCEWAGWDPPLRDREPAALDRARDELAERIEFVVFCQFLFAEQWSALRDHARSCGVSIVGDIPIFVAHDSADVWANRHLFKLDAEGHPRVMAGVPPDYFSATGQLWGNPLYDWEAMGREGYAWWIARFRLLAELVDLVRVDHFRGFQAAWEVPAGATTAVDGAWVPGPGTAVFDAISAGLGRTVPILAEDLGMITDDVRDLLAATGFPGMKVLQFAFGGASDNFYLPHNYRDPNCVVYTGTHDNDTTRGWFESAPEHERSFAMRYIGTDGSDMSWSLMRLALSSIANTCIVPLQDVLDLGSAARMNTPGSTESNWSWRACPAQLDPARADRLAEETTLFGRA